MKFENISPFVRQAITGIVNQNTKYDISNRLKTRDCRLFYIMSGNGSMTIDNKEYHIKPKTAILFKAGTEYMWNVKEVRFYSVNFDYTQNCSDIKETFHPIHSKDFNDKYIFQTINFEDVTELNNASVIQNASVLENRIKLLATEYYIGGAYCDMSLSTILKSVIISIVQQNCNVETAQEEKGAVLARKIVEYIGENYNKKISNKTIAEEFHFNPSYINRVFKNHIGTAMHEFLLNYRFDIAMELLHTQNTTIKDIAWLTGFEDLPHFTKAFKKRMGKTPGEYRKSKDLKYITSVAPPSSRKK